MSDVPLGFDSLDVFPDKLTEPEHRREWTGRRQGGTRVPYGESEGLLRRELEMIRARSAVIQVAATHDAFTRTGLLRANAKTDHPGVVLTVTGRDGETLTFATDEFTHWQDNVRAIALGLEALRKLDRYGITRGQKQYAGFKALPPGGYVAPEQKEMTEEEAVATVCRLAGAAEAAANAWFALPGDVQKTMVRTAVKNAHPDGGGADGDMQDLMAARKILAI